MEFKKNSIKYVGMWGFNKASAKENHVTEGLFPCVSGAFYNKETDESYLLHFPGVLDYKMEEKLKKIKDEIGPRLEIFLTGGGTSKNKPKEYNNHVKEERELFEKLTKKYFPNSNITVKWNLENTASDLEIRKSTKKFIYKTYPSWDAE